MADFKPAYDLVAKHEGGYQNNPNDPGNYNSRGENVGTKWGVSAKKYEKMVGHPPTVDEMKYMPQWRAEAAFRGDEWKRMMGDEIPWQPVANILFDGVVNHGQGVKLLQQVLNIPADNIFGQQTLKAVLASDPQWLYDAYKKRRVDYYHQLANNDPKLKVFLNGWLNRINSFTDHITDAVQQGAEVVKSNPGASLGTAVAAGVVLWLIFRRD